MGTVPGRSRKMVVIFKITIKCPLIGRANLRSKRQIRNVGSSPKAL